MWSVHLYLLYAITDYPHLLISFRFQPQVKHILNGDVLARY